MTTVRILMVVLILLVPASLQAFHLHAVTKGGLVRITSQHRDLIPGEVIKISLEYPAFSSAWAYFQGQRYDFGRGRDAVSYFIVIGISLDLEPGIYDLSIHVEQADGSVRDYFIKLPVSKGKYPIRKISIDEKYIFPPPEARKRIDEELQLLHTVYSAFTPEWLGRGRFIVPSGGSVKKNFGERRVFNEIRHSRHRGVDIGSGYGKPVWASNAGKVVLTRNLYYAGNAVIIDHGMGIFSVYCHLSGTVVKEGTMVDKGDLIGRIGATGRVTGPHLHWGLKVSDQFVNPLTLLHFSFNE
jgi:murein DD-endopeptidase MepM/ murein hydrolase activator NlpD